MTKQTGGISRRDVMKKAAVTSSAVVLGGATMSGSVAAQNPHFVRGPTASCSGDELCFSGKVAGLGNAIETVVITTSAVAEVEEECLTRGNRKNPPAENKSSFQSETTNSDQFPVRNGQVTFSNDVCLSAPGPQLSCPPGQNYESSTTFTDVTLSVEGTDLEENFGTISCD